MSSLQEFSSLDILHASGFVSLVEGLIDFLFLFSSVRNRYLADIAFCFVFPQIFHTFISHCLISSTPLLFTILISSHLHFSGSCWLSRAAIFRRQASAMPIASLAGFFFDSAYCMTSFASLPYGARMPPGSRAPPLLPAATQRVAYGMMPRATPSEFAPATPGSESACRVEFFRREAQNRP